MVSPAVKLNNKQMMSAHDTLPMYILSAQSCDRITSSSSSSDQTSHLFLISLCTFSCQFVEDRIEGKTIVRFPIEGVLQWVFFCSVEKVA